MNDHDSNIEIINFDYSMEPQNNIFMEFHHEDNNKDYLNLYFLEKSGCDNFDQNESMEHYLSNSFTNMNNDSFSSYYSNDAMSCLSENLSYGVPIAQANDTNDKSLNASFDNCNLDSFSEKKRKSFNCPFKDCIKVYKSKENLTLHYKNIHLKEKPYSCKYCSAVFSHRNGNY
jgi:hypothetical protein